MEKETTFEKLLFDDRIKPKNVLALNEKVAAIRRYEIEPVYKKIGRIFNCSPDQIKRIIKQKNEILAEWENRTKKPPAPTSHEIKTVRVSVLGKAVHEWIRRIMYYTDFNLNDTLIKTMALEFSKVLQMGKFYPSVDWIANFRATYNLPDANTKTMSIGYQESHSVQIRDILLYVQDTCGTSNALMVDNKPNLEHTVSGTLKMSDTEVGEIKTETDCSDICGDVVMKVEEEKFQPSCSTVQQCRVVPENRTLPTINSKIVIQIDPEETYHPPLPMRPKTTKEVKLSSTNQQHHVVPEKRTLPTIHSKMMQVDAEETSYPPLPMRPKTIITKEVKVVEPEPKPEQISIHSHDAAISCVKLLEEFALLKENFRLIGLIERLEEALNEKSKQKC